MLRLKLTQCGVARIFHFEMNAPLDLSKLLSDTLEERCKRNPRYSLRAFARDLGVPAPRLSRWLKGEEGLSRTSAHALATSLGFSKEETNTFVTAMESRFARSKKMRESAKEKLKTLSAQYQSLDVDAFKVIADWYNLAALSLIETEGFTADASWVAHRLGISIYEAKGALQRLKSLEMIEESEGSYKPTGVFFANAAGIPSQSVRSFHTQILEKAKAALELQPVSERDFSTLVLAVDESEIEHAKIAIKQFREAFESRFCNSNTRKKEVFALGVQFFRVTEKMKPTGEKL